MQRAVATHNTAQRTQQAVLRASGQQQQWAGHELRQLVGVHLLVMHRLAAQHYQVRFNLIREIADQHAGLRAHGQLDGGDAVSPFWLQTYTALFFRV